MFHVKPDLNIYSIAHFLQKMGFTLSQGQIDKLITLRKLVEQWNKKHNIISSSDTAFIIERHILPSLYLGYNLDIYDNQKLADIGTGGGFPGIVLAILFPKISITFFESSNKKSLILKVLCDQINIYPTIINQRVESFNINQEEKFDIVTTRAVAPIEKLLRLVKQIVKPNATLYSLSGGADESDSDNIFQIQKLKPSKEWENISDYLVSKFIMKVEINNG